MLLKQLEYFVCVVDNNSFTQAATEQYVSQSANISANQSS